MRRAVVLIATLPFLAACTGADAKRDAEIAFTVNRDGYGEIWLMRPDGSDRRRLTRAASPQTDAAGARTPAWSPDGMHLAYSFSPSDARRPSDIYVMSADGDDVRHLTMSEGVDEQPSWSPDGKRIVFARFTGIERRDQRGIVVIGADGRTETQLPRVAGPTFDAAPAWSPDGSTIAFTRLTVRSDLEHEKLALYIVAPGGNGLTKLIDGGGQGVWSPDGKRIAFTSIRDRFGRTCFEECTPSGEIYVADADGSHQRRLTRSRADDRSPTWSPDGRSIAFVSDRSDPQLHDNEIYVMRADGSDLQKITSSGDWSLDPAWRPAPK